MLCPLPVSRKERSARERQLQNLKDAEYFKASYAQIRRRLRALEDEHFRFVDLSGVFDDYGSDADIFVDSFHFGDRGNEIIARSLFEDIRSLVLRDAGAVATRKTTTEMD